MRTFSLIITFAIGYVSAALAQEEPTTFVFEGNNFRWHQTTNGSYFYSPEEGLPGLEVPIGESNYSIYASALWLGGINALSEVQTSYKRFCQNEDENCTENWGPLKTDGSLATSAEIEPYNHIWFVTTGEIELYNAYFDCLENPSCDESLAYPDYDIPEDFVTWPAQPTEGLGFADYLAPFVDRNGDGNYSTQDGDYPAICGDFSSFLIWNGQGSELVNAPGANTKSEFHTTFYGYNGEDDALFNTLFVKHKIINRGEETLSDSYLGLWTDFDIGNHSDDHVQSDVERSMFYGFNADLFDEGSSAGPGYGYDVPAMGLKVLAGPQKDENQIDDNPIYASNYGNETLGYGDGIIDNERLGLYSSFSYNNASGPTATHDPTAPLDYYNFMQAVWRDGTPFTFGGSGYNPFGGVTARFGFPGESDPLMAGTSGVDPNYNTAGGWTEANEGFSSGDRRMIGSSGPFTFAPGDVQHIDLAYIFARESFDESETAIETLQRFADEVEGMQCEALPAIALSADKGLERKPLQVFPNPSSEGFSFELNEESSEYTLIDITGKVVDQRKLNEGLQFVDISKLTSGIYIIKIQADRSVYHGKVVIER